MSKVQWLANSGSHEREQEVLAGADRDNAGAGRRLARAGKEFCNCSFYLYAVLAGSWF